MARKEQQPYGIPAADQSYGTYERQPLAPFNAAGVLAPTLAAHKYAEDAVQSYNVNLYQNEGMAQDREARKAYHPYRMGQIPYNGQADVIGAQTNLQRRAAGAARAGLGVDKFDSLINKDQFYNDTAGKYMLGETDLPTSDNPHLAPEADAYLSQVENSDPFKVASSLPPNPATAGAGAAAGGTQQPDPLAGAKADPATPSINIAGEPTPNGTSSGPTNPRGGDGSPLPAPQVQPNAPAVYGLRSGVNANVLGMATTRLHQLQGVQNGLRTERQKLVDQLSYAKGTGDTTAVRNLTFGLQELDSELRDAGSALQTHVKYMQDKVYENKNAQPTVPGENYGQTAIADDPITETKGVGSNYSYDSTATIPPPARMPKALIEPFKQAATLYQQYAPGGYGGTETGLLIAALESDFRAGAKNTGHIGMTQFSQDTFNRIAKQTAWGKGMSPRELEIARGKPAYQAKAERQYRHNNYVKAVTKYKGLFDPNNPLNLYAQHHFGEDTGAKIAAAYKKDRNMPLSKAMGLSAYNSALAGNSYLAEDGVELTVGQLYSNWINRAKAKGFYGGVAA